MIRDSLKEIKGFDHDPVFRWRGEAVTRLENLSDIAFAVALGMIISGVDAPRNFDQLIRFLIYSIPAAAGFSVLLGVWMQHYTFFRRYGISDARIIFLNAILLFLVLYMAYPLRFAFDALYGWAIGVTTGDMSRNVEIGVMTFEISGYIIAVYAFIFAACMSVLAMMYGYVSRQKTESLNLNAYEIALTRRDHFSTWTQAGLAFCVGLLGWLTQLNGFAGFLLFFIAVPKRLAHKLYPLPDVEADHADS